jgi:hypothetical protein
MGLAHKTRRLHNLRQPYEICLPHRFSLLHNFKAASHNNTASKAGEAMLDEAALSDEDVSPVKASSQISLPQNMYEAFLQVEGAALYAVSSKCEVISHKRRLPQKKLLKADETALLSALIEEPKRSESCACGTLRHYFHVWTIVKLINWML